MKRNSFIYYSLLLLGSFSFITSCQDSEIPVITEINPAAEGFNQAGSDDKAIALADSVMIAMGGRKAFDDTRYIKWNFFNARRHVWDKQEGLAYIEGIRDTFTILMDLDDMTGKVNWHGNELTKADSLDQYLERGKSMWINDAYWLAMPFKLKDSGVTLTYHGKDSTEAGVLSEVLQLTFDTVGDTPQNKYLVYVDPASHLITQWDFYSTSVDSVARFKTPWNNYEKHGEILLSGDRGGNRKLTEIEVGPQLASYFEMD